MSNHSHLSLDEKIACLVEDVGELRVELQKALATLRDTNNVPGALTTTSRVAERLITDLFAAAKRKPKNGTMEKQINELIEQGFLPAERATYLHTIRTLANKARHDAEKATFRAADAESALSGLLLVLEWFFCECGRGMKLSSVYSIGAQQVITATVAVQRLEAELERLRQELIQQGQRRRELTREPIVGLRFADVSDTFKNREDKLAELRQLLGDKTVKMVLIVGRGGIGKTALLCKICEEIERGELTLSDIPETMGADGIVYVSCRGTDKPTVERLFHDVGRLLGNPHADELNECWKDAGRSLTEKLRFLLAKLRDGCYLLVLDNLEDVLAPDNTIADSDLRTFVDLCLATPHALRLVATSRERVVLGSSGVRAARTVPLDKGLDEPDAISLLRTLDKSGELGLRDAPEEQLRVAAQRTYGIPYAIVRIATLLTDAPMLTLDKLLSDESLFTEQVVENLIAEHYRRISIEHRRVLEALAVYNKSVPAVAVRYLLHPFFPTLDVDAALSALVRNYSVTYNRGRDTFDLHPLDRQYTYARIPDDGDYTKRMLHRCAAEFYSKLRKPRSEWKTIDDLQPQLQEFHHLVQATEFDQAYNLIGEELLWKRLMELSAKVPFLALWLVQQAVDAAVETDNASAIERFLELEIKALSGDVPVNFNSFYDAMLTLQRRREAEPSQDTIRIWGPQGEALWLRCVTFFDVSWEATSFVSIPKGWRRVFAGNVGLSIQKAKVEEGKTIRRLFVVETDAELEELHDTIAAQCNAGIQVKYLLHDASELREAERKVGTIDFVVIDKKYLLRIFLNPQRRVIGAELVKNALSEVDIFNRLWVDASFEFVSRIMEKLKL